MNAVKQVKNAIFLGTFVFTICVILIVHAWRYRP